MRIHPIRVRETTCYLLEGHTGAVLIDTGPPGGAQTIVDGAAAAGLRREEMQLIVLTHGHLDHYGATAEVKAWCGAPVAAHPDAPAFSQRRRNALPPGQTLRASILRWLYLLLSPFVRFDALQADLLLDSDTDLSPYGVEAKTIHLPGHSPDSLGVITAEQDVFVGDLFVNYSVPSKPLYLSDGEAWHHSYQHIRSLQPERVYVGHGDPFPGNQLERIYPARYQLRWWVR